MRETRSNCTNKPSVVLDRPQAIGLGLFSIISGGLMFGLGYVTGKARPPLVVTATNEGTLGRIDRAHELHQELKNDPVDYTFFRELTAKDDVKVTRPTKANEHEDKGSASEVVKEFAAKKDGAVVKEAVGKEVAAKEVVVKEPVNKEPVVKELDTPKIAKSNEVSAEEATLAAAAAGNDTRTGDAHNSVAAPAKTATLTAMADDDSEPAPAVSGTTEYTLQVSAFRSEDEAKASVRKLAARGLQASFVAAELPGKGTWYRVRVGRFKTEVAAKLYKQQLDLQSLRAWVVKAD